MPIIQTQDPNFFLRPAKHHKTEMPATDGFAGGTWAEVNGRKGHSRA